MTARRWALTAAGLGVALAGLSACGSSGTGGSTAVHSITPASSTPTVVTAPPTSLAGPVPTVFDCGGGAYEPKTLLVVCGVNTTTVTNVTWTSWSTAGAAGSGTVNLHGGPGQQGSGPATLALSGVVQTGNGPQFSVLQVTWTAASPDGHPTDRFELAVAPG